MNGPAGDRTTGALPLRLQHGDAMVAVIVVALRRLCKGVSNSLNGV